jgi:hypothetical protein
MLGRRLSSLGASLVVLAAVVASLLLTWGPTQGSPAAQATVQPTASLTARELPDGVRYAVAVVRAPRTALRDLRVDVQLPPGAQLVEAYETPGFTQFLGSDGGVLRWVAPAFPRTNAGGGFTGCGAQVCSGTIFQRGLFRRDGVNTCHFTPGGGNPSCSFEPT